MTTISIYTGFDGTLTKEAGQNVVKKDFYQSLLVGYQAQQIQDYKSTPMKDSFEVQLLLQKKFGRYDLNFNWSQADTDCLISPEAVHFLYEMLNDAQIKLNIVTKNKAEYIRAVLRFQGFSEKELSKINIMDSGDKYSDVKQSLQGLSETTTLYLFEDNPQDYKAMMDAAKEADLYHNIKGFQIQPHLFVWQDYLEEIQKLKAQNDSQKSADFQSLNTKKIFLLVIVGLVIGLCLSNILLGLGLTFGAYGLANVGAGYVHRAISPASGENAESGTYQLESGLTLSHAKMRAIGNITAQESQEQSPVEHHSSVIVEPPKRTKKRMALSDEKTTVKLSISY